MTNKIQKITTNFWFDTQAEEAANFYVSIFEHSHVIRTTRYKKAGNDIHGKNEGSVMTVEFQLNDQKFVALNGGPQFKFNEAISFIVNCETQNEVDYYWEKLSDGGDENAQMCGWLKDKFGVSWQIVPTALYEMQNGTDSEKSERVMKALLQMKKIDINALKEAYEG
jgi:predicted 3-demethylubiquinone-9 3-methyltransferase (glyoxalase superfamily)